MANVRRIEPRMPIIPKRERVAAYARVSLEKDSMIHSLSAQISYYSDMIQKNPAWIYAGVYADGAFTGTKAERPEFQRLLEDCRAGRIDRIITKSISRFARNTVTMLKTVRELKAMGIDVYFEKEHLHSTSGDGELMLTVLAAFAQEESKSVSDNMKWSIRKRYEKGEPVNWRFLYGYRITRGHVEIYEPEAAIVRWIFEKYTGGMTVAEITRRLCESGTRAMRGAEWTIQKVDAILGNEKYAGNAVLQKYFIADHLTKLERINHGECEKYYAEGTHPPVIDPVTWEKAQAIMERNRTANGIRFGERRTANYPFTGRIICGHCGKTFHRKILRGKIFWNCYTYLYKGKAACPAKMIPEHVLTETASEVLEIPEFDPDIFRARIREIRVPDSNRLIFVFRDGHEVERNWQDRSRAESWTPEMRTKAAKHAGKGHEK